MKLPFYVSKYQPFFYLHTTFTLNVTTVSQLQLLILLKSNDRWKRLVYLCTYAPTSKMAYREKNYTHARAYVKKRTSTYTKNQTYKHTIYIQYSISVYLERPRAPLTGTAGPAGRGVATSPGRMTSAGWFTTRNKPETGRDDRARRCLEMRVTCALLFLQVHREERWVRLFSSLCCRRGGDDRRWRLRNFARVRCGNAETNGEERKKERGPLRYTDIREMGAVVEEEGRGGLEILRRE